MQRVTMRNSAHRFGVASLFVGLFFGLVCQVVSPAEGHHVLPESGSGTEFHSTAVCQSPLMTPAPSLVEYPYVIAAIATVVLGEPPRGHTLPFYRPPRSNA